MVKLIKDVFAVPDGAIYPRLYRAGEEVSGSVLQAAIEQGAVEIEKDRPLVVKPKRGRPLRKG